MSADINVFIDYLKLPSKEKWEAAIAEHGFDLKFCDGFDPKSHSGFLPCLLTNREAGFEYDCDELEDTMFDTESNPEIKGRDRCIGFCSSYEQDDLSSAMIAASTLSKLSDGVFWMVDDFITNEDPLEIAKDIMENGL